MAHSSLDIETNTKSTSLSTKCKVLAAVVLIAILVVFVILIALLVKQQKTIDDYEQICSAPACQEVSGKSMSKMDLSVDPCNDFYEYACAHAVKDYAYNIAPDVTQWDGLYKAVKRNDYINKRILDNTTGVFLGKNSSAIRKVKQYYTACMDKKSTGEQDMERLKEMIAEVGGWPLIDETWSEAGWSLESSFVAATRLKASVFIDFMMYNDLKNNSVYKLIFGTATPSLEGYNVAYTNEAYNETFYSIFRNYFVGIANCLGANQTEAESLARQIWDFETEFVKELSTPSDSVYPIPMTMRELSDMVSEWLDLPVFLGDLFGEPVPDDEIIDVQNPTFVEKYSALMKKSWDKRFLSNYLTWKVLNTYAPVVANPIHATYRKLRESLDPSAPFVLWEGCVDRVNKILTHATGALFVERTIPEGTKERITEMVEVVREVVKEGLEELDWMDSQTKASALEKLKNLHETLAYPQAMLDVSKLDAFYDDLKVESGSELQNYITSNELDVSKNLALRNTLYIPGELEIPLGMTWSTVNAFNLINRNSMVILPGFLQAPMYDVIYPTVWLFGSIGTTIAHEIFHGFDTLGRDFDERGNVYNWWTNESSSRFESRTQCMIDQYSAYNINGYQINGNLTIGENIADNGGVKYGYRAMQRWKDQRNKQDLTLPGLNMTDEQMFFLSFSQLWCTYQTEESLQNAINADVHSPAKYRVIGTLHNSPEFAEAYQCAKGTYMNPENKCTVF